MSNHGIGNYNFEHWEGPPPALPEQHVMEHHRAGAAGVALHVLGKWGDTFETVLTSHWSTGAKASLQSHLMLDMVGAGWYPLQYATINYTGIYGVGYHVVNIQHLDIHVASILIGPGYAFTNGGVLVSRFTLTPEIIESG